MTPFVLVKSFLHVGKEKKRKELKETQLQGTLMNVCLVLNSKCFSLILVRTKILIKQNIIGSINKNRSHAKLLLPEFFFILGDGSLVPIILLTCFSLTHQPFFTKASKDFDYTPSSQTAYLLHRVCLLDCPSYEEYLDESGDLFVFLVDFFGFLEEFVKSCRCKSRTFQGTRIKWFCSSWQKMWDRHIIINLLRGTF